MLQELFHNIPLPQLTTKTNTIIIIFETTKVLKVVFYYYLLLLLLLLLLDELSGGGGGSSYIDPSFVATTTTTFSVARSVGSGSITITTNYPVYTSSAGMIVVGSYSPSGTTTTTRKLRHVSSETPSTTITNFDWLLYDLIRKLLLSKGQKMFSTKIIKIQKFKPDTTTTTTVGSNNYHSKVNYEVGANHNYIVKGSLKVLQQLTLQEVTTMFKTLLKEYKLLDHGLYIKKFKGPKRT